MDGAAAYGHLAVVEWLQSNRNEGCTSYALCGAAENGYIDVVVFLLNRRASEFGAAELDCAIKRAGKNGHSAVVQFLSEIRQVVVT